MLLLTLRVHDFNIRELKIGKPFPLPEFDLELGDKKKAEERGES